MKTTIALLLLSASSLLAADPNRVFTPRPGVLTPVVISRPGEGDVTVIEGGDTNVNTGSTLTNSITGQAAYVGSGVSNQWNADINAATASLAANSRITSTRFSTLFTDWEIVDVVLTNNGIAGLGVSATATAAYLKNGLIGLYYEVYTNGFSATGNRGTIEASFGTRWDNLTKHGPVLEPTPAAWDSGNVGGSKLYWENGTNWMTYFGSTGAGFESFPLSMGLAYSTDGTNWTKYAGNPIIVPGAGGTWNDAAIFCGGIYKYNNTYYQLINASDGSQEAIGLYTSPAITGPWTEYAGNPVINPGGFTADATIIPLKEGGWAATYRNSLVFSALSVPCWSYSLDLTNWSTIKQINYTNLTDVPVGRNAVAGNIGLFSPFPIVDENGYSILMDDTENIFRLRPKSSGLFDASKARLIDGATSLTSNSWYQATNQTAVSTNTSTAAQNSLTTRYSTLLTEWEVSGVLTTNLGLDALGKIDHPTAAYLKNGYIGLYFQVFTNGFSAGNRGTIEAAFGTRWDNLVKHGTVLSPTGAAWDSGQVGGPRLYWENGTNWMTYWGGTGTGFATPPTSLGLAYSTDGTNWTKYASNPIITVGSGGTWNDGSIFDGHIMKYNGVYYMLVLGSDGAVETLGLYTSSAIMGPWTEYASNPVISGGFPSDANIIPLLEGGWAAVMRNAGLFGGTSVPCWSYSVDLTNWTAPMQITTTNLTSTTIGGNGLYGIYPVYDERGYSFLMSDLTNNYILRPRSVGLNTFGSSSSTTGLTNNSSYAWTNNTGYYGNGIGFTNIPMSAFTNGTTGTAGSAVVLSNGPAINNPTISSNITGARAIFLSGQDNISMFGLTGTTAGMLQGSGSSIVMLRANSGDVLAVVDNGGQKQVTLNSAGRIGWSAGSVNTITANHAEFRSGATGEIFGRTNLSMMGTITPTNGVALIQTATVPTNSIPAGGNNGLLVNTTNADFNGPAFFTTNTAGAGLFNTNRFVMFKNSDVQTSAFTNEVAARLPIVINGTTYYITLSTNVP